MAGSTEGDPYPRTYADEELSQLLVEGPLSLVGSGITACTNGLPVTGDRWCAFSRETAEGATELWVVNITAAIAQPPIACDESSSACLKLTTTLWTGAQLWGPMHPYVHRFDGDTLLFLADAPDNVRQPYEGPVYAWRPGWESARRVTSDRGALCTGHRRSAAVFCIDALDVDPDAESVFGAPLWQSFDLIAGHVDVPPESALPLVERIPVPDGDPQSFRAQLARTGDRLAYSYPVAEQSTLRWVPLDTEEIATPTRVLDDAVGWMLAHDGNAVYYLRAFDPETQLGELMVADFPTGANAQAIAPDVAHIDPVGAVDDPQSDQDRGIGFDRWRPEGASFDFLADRSMPTETVMVGVDLEAPRVSPDGVHSLFYQSNGPSWPVATVARNDGSGRCTLNTELGAETYAGTFSPDGQRVLWVEYGRSGSEEGWIAAPGDCQQKTKFGDWVLGFSLIDDFVYFEGGDEADSTSYLQYARIPSGPTSGTVTPLVIMQNPRYPLVGLHLGDAAHLVYASALDAEQPGLFAHGPLELGFPPE
jgi:hypothetical protein